MGRGEKHLVTGALGVCGGMAEGENLEESDGAGSFEYCAQELGS